MSILDPNAWTKAAKVLYPEGFEQVWYPDSPFVAWMPKSYDFEGDARNVNPLIEGVQGGSTISAALNQQTVPIHDKFVVTRKKEYVVFSVDNEVIRASRSKKGAIASAMKTAMDAAFYAFGQQVGFLAWGDGTGTRATVGSYAAGAGVTGVITLKNIRDVHNFAKNMLLESKTSGTKNAGTLLITGVDRENGKLSITKQGGAADPAANDTLARFADYTASGGNVMTGVLGWIPTTAPTAGDSFKSVDRSQDVNRLAGTRYKGASRPIVDVTIEAQAELSFHGGRADTLWVNSIRFAELLKSLQSKSFVMRDVGSSGGATGKVAASFSAIQFAGEKGPVSVMADPKCPYGYGLLTRREAWELACLDDCPHFSDEDGNKFRLEQSSDGIQGRMKAYGEFICNRPVDCCLIDWDN